NNHHSEIYLTRSSNFIRHSFHLLSLGDDLIVADRRKKTMKVKNFDAKTGEELSQVKLSADQSARLIRVLKEAR
ncbi:hypothetical protein ACLOA0_09660, partial [Limosilactobacillus fermentum]|uniref:hypothetical protein n=1 Tax=Limosilactobacillus fermentum TaxID=1613 RepID=UPI003EBB37D9